MNPILLIRSILPILALLDIYATYWRVKNIKELNPKLNPEAMEMNVLTKYLWKKYGLKLGSFYSGIFSFLIVSVLAFSFEWFFVGLMYGVYLIVFALHLRDISAIRIIINKKVRR